MSNLAVRAFSSFPSSVYGAAVRAVHAGLVRLLESSRRDVILVGCRDRGFEHKCTYDLSELKEFELPVGCTCDEAIRGNLCFHIFAGLILIGRSPRFAGHTFSRTINAYFAGQITDQPNETGDLEFPQTKPSVSPEAKHARRQWEQPLSYIREAKQRLGYRRDSDPPTTSRDEQWWCRLSLSESQDDKVVLRFAKRFKKKNGEWSCLKPSSLEFDSISIDSPSGPILSTLFGLGIAQQPHYMRYQGVEMAEIGAAHCRSILRQLCEQQILDVVDREIYVSSEPMRVLAWDAGENWNLQAELCKAGTVYRLAGQFVRGEETVPISDCDLLLKVGLFLANNTLYSWQSKGNAGWCEMFRRFGKIEIPEDQIEEFEQQLWSMSELPVLKLPDTLKWEEENGELVPVCRFLPPSNQTPANLLAASVTFSYGGVAIDFDRPGNFIADSQARKLTYRDLNRESECLALLTSLGIKGAPGSRRKHHPFELPAKSLPRIVPRLIASGWQVQAEGKLFRRAGEFRCSVRSELNWFEMEGSMDFDGQTVELPQLLQALEKGQSFVTLGDGTQGLLPEDWLAKFAPLANFGTTKDSALTFKPSQVAILDALLASMPNVGMDEQFEIARQRICEFQGVMPANPPESFQGELRAYQREGLGWLHFLREFGFGGCLADDMGLGKTVQVLALLESRRVTLDRKERAPSLVVVPRSLVFNWKQEAQRFAPELKVLDYSSSDRNTISGELKLADLVVATYGTLRRDILSLKDQTFDYVFLDEAQAIKNPQSQAAKACRLLNARHRIALTGTPVENHLGELWSICDFLNPGMLGRSTALKVLTSSARASESDESIKLLAKALRPFILRRTKEQVLTELPAKTEQTIYCELEGEQRRHYNELRDHYRSVIQGKISAVGLKNAKIDVLTALLRLRQAACHPGLIDKSLSDQPSAKLEALLNHLDEATDNGHKALVFSQFTSLLSIVRSHLDRKEIVYEYLDGKTRNRQQKVDRFQTDPDCRLFLISLKAGGNGLNLTAADYVFILDPWWNPAVEAQAIDRAHRIGQDKAVFAYRLIARDTVEEKIIQLQSQKRQLADAIISADNSLMSELSAEDLELLLS